MKLVLVRHGETQENAKGIIQGHRFGTLSEKGREQAESVAKELAKEHFDIIYTSDLERCVDTAAAIRQHHAKTRLVLRTELREFSFGIFEGMPSPRTDGNSRTSRLAMKIGFRLPKRVFGVESPRDVKKRVISFVNHIYSKHKGGTVLVVTHGGPIRIIKSAVEGTPLDQNMRVDVPNCSIWRFNITKTLPLSGSKALFHL